MAGFWVRLADFRHLSRRRDQRGGDPPLRIRCHPYADRFDGYAGEKLKVTGEQPAPSGVMVKSQIIKAGGEPVKVDYMMRRNGETALTV